MVLDEIETMLFQFMLASSSKTLDYENLQVSIESMSLTEQLTLINLNWDRYIDCLSFKLIDWIKYKIKRCVHRS
jgi:hypothetical protein